MNETGPSIAPAGELALVLAASALWRRWEIGFSTSRIKSQEARCGLDERFLGRALAQALAGTARRKAS